MKPAPLLLFLPLLFPVCVLAASPLTKPEVRADGRYEFRDNARITKFRIATDELHQSGAAGNKRILISARDHVKKVQDAAKSMARSDRKFNLIAYPEGKPRTDANRRVVTNSVEVRLAEGMDPTVIGQASNAKKVKSFSYLPGYHILEFSDAVEALTAAEALATIPGVTLAETVLAENRFIPAYIPNDPLFGIPFQGTRTLPNADYPISLDLTDEKVPLAAPASWLNTPQMLQWYLNYNNSLLFRQGLKTQIPAVLFSNYRLNSLPAFVEPNDYLLDGGRGIMPFEIVTTPPRATPANGERSFPRYFELATDINVIPAWDIIGPPITFNGVTTPGTPLDGNNVKVAVIDDGIQKNHPDLTASNIISSWNYIDGGNDPTPPANQGLNHGTGAAGLIAAKRDNNIGMTGIAPNAKLIGLRITGSFLPASDFADAFTWTGTYNSGSNPLADISVFAYSASSSADVVYLQPLVKAALKDGAEKGRNRKGMVYVVPAGNEGEYHADTNYSELSNSLYTITVGAVSDIGRRIIYSQPGASLQVVAPSSGEEMAPRIRTTNAVVANPDNGSVAVPANTLVPALPLVMPATPQKRCLGWTVSPDEYDNLNSGTRSTQRILSLNSVASSVTIPPSAGAAIGFNYNYGGTSASCSMVAGVTALMLQARPSLGYRDVMEILMRSARVVDPMMGEWQYNSLGIPFSHKYGAGLVDADHAVRMAKKWRNLQTQTVLERTLPADTIGDFPALGSVRSFSGPSSRVEHVTVRLKVQHGRRGDLGIILSSPASGQADTPVESYLMVPHREDFSQDIGNPARSDNDGIESDGEYWTFMSVHHWGTSPSNQLLGSTQAGNDWTLRIFDSTKQGITDYVGANAANPNAVQPENRVYCPVANPIATAEVPIKVISAKVSFYGSASDGLNEPPSIQTNAFPVKTKSQFAFKVKASTDLSGDDEGFPRAPIYDYRLRMTKVVSSNTPDLEIAPGTSTEHAILYPTPVTTPADAAGKSPAYFRFNRSTGLLTNEPYLPGGQAFRPLPEGEWLVEVQATSIFGTTRRQVTFKVEKALTYPEWKSLYFSVTEQAAVNFDQLDPDQDGVPNLLEYTMGGVPTVREPDLFPPPVMDSGNLVFTYKADLSAQGFRVIPQFSTNPVAGWQDARNTVPPLAVLQDQESSLQQWKVSLPMSPSTKAFFRLKAEVIPP